MDTMFLNHMRELSRRADKTGRFQFTDFLSLAEQSDLLSLHDPTVTLWGGMESSERKMARFGSPEAFGYEEDFPFTLLAVTPLSEKFAEALSHRDYLGALMNEQIQRSKLGDIVLAEKKAYLFASNTLAEYICSSLTRVKHTAVCVSPCEKLPDTVLQNFKEVAVNVASLRLDCVISSVHKLSRSQTAALFSMQKVFVNGALEENLSRQASEGDMISVRGLGRFCLLSEGGTSKKGKLWLNIRLYL